jgi:hypothetical protein
MVFPPFLTPAIIFDFAAMTPIDISLTLFISPYYAITAITPFAYFRRFRCCLPFAIAADAADDAYAMPDMLTLSLFLSHAADARSAAAPDYFITLSGLMLIADAAIFAMLPALILRRYRHYAVFAFAMPYADAIR